ncbi:hypothetical protein [Luteimicrobium sp. DT211]|uniref:hypothetical protein n=1 Tax=Luteimicrobium sp. DT211 TaxID=3393412 RepID=UPI003CE75141
MGTSAPARSGAPAARGPRLWRVVLYAVLCSFVPWALGGAWAAVTRAREGFPIGGGSFAGVDADRWLRFADDWFIASSYVLPFVAAALVAGWVVVVPQRSRWALALAVTVLVSAVVLLMAFGDGFVHGAGSPFGYGVVALLLSVVTLDLPLCFVLAAWLAVPLRVLAPPARPLNPWR